MIEVWNKIDLLPPGDAEALEQVAARTPNVCAISAVTGQGVPALLAAIERAVVDIARDETLQLGFDQGQKRAWLFDRKLVQSERQTDEGYELAVRWSERDRDRYSRL
jgi:GTP-binding protein HflX